MPAPLTRLNLAAAVPDGPSVQTPIVPLPYQPIPQVHQQNLPLSTLGDSLSGFGNKITAALHDFGQADIAEARAETHRANEDYAAQATADAGAGRPADDSLNGFHAYAKTYSTVTGHLAGTASAEQFQAEVGSKLGPGDDPAKALSDWQAAHPLDTGNPIYDGSAYAAFGTRAQAWRSDFGRNAVQAAVADGTQQWGSSLALTVQDGTLTGQTIATAIADYGRLNPMNASKAGQMVINTLMGQARTPEEARRVMTALAEPGSAGPATPDKSFAQQFPDAFAHGDATLAARHGQVLTLAAAQNYDRIAEDLQNAKVSPNPIGELPRILGDLDRTASMFGGNDRRLALRGQAEHMLAGAVKITAAVNQIDVGRTDPVNRDVGTFTQHFDDWLKFKGVNPLSGEAHNGGLPQNIVAGSMVGSYNAIDGKTKANVSNAMIDPINPQAQMRAVEFYRAAEGQVGPERVLALMTEEAGKFYQSVAHDPDIANAIARTSNTPKGDAPTLEAITGKANHIDATAKMKTTVDTAISNYVGVNGWLSENAAIAPMVHTQVSAMIHQDAMDAARRGPVNLDKIAADAMQRASNSIQVLPGTDGRRIISWMPDTPQFVRDPANPDKLRPVIQAGRNVMNPATGKPEDTTATAEADMQALATRLPGRIGDRSGLSLEAQGGTEAGRRFQTQGLLTVTQGKSMVVFMPGESVEVAGNPTFLAAPGTVVPGPTTKVKVTGDPAAVGAEIGKVWPNSPFTLVPIQTPQGTGYALAYRYHFQDTRPNGAQREQSFESNDAITRKNDAARIRAQQQADPNNRRVVPPTPEDTYRP